MGHNLFRPVIGQRQDGAAIGHHGARALGHGHQAVSGNVHGHQEIFETGVHELAAQLVLVGKADRVNHEIQRFPARPDRVESRVERIHVRHVAFYQEIRPKRFGQRPHTLFQRIALIGKGQLRTMFGQLAGDAPCQ